MYSPDDPEPPSNELPSEQVLPDLCKRVEKRLQNLEDIDIDALGPEEARQLAHELRTELRRQKEVLKKAEQIDVLERKQAAEEVQSRKTENHRVKQRLRRQTAELTASNIRLADEKHFLSAVMEALPSGVAIIDKSGGIILTNKACERIWGGSPEVRSVQDYSHYQAWWEDTDIPVAPEEWAPAIALKEGKTTLGQMMRVRRFDGKELFILNSASPLYDDEGNVIGSAVAIEDITELKRVQRAHFESEQRLRLFIEHAPVALAMFDRNLRYLIASRRWVKDCGLENHDLTGLLAHEIHHIPERWQKANYRGLAGEVLEAEEDRYRRYDGTVRWIRWKIHPWYGATGEVGGIVVFTEDITPRKQIEEQLRLLNEELEQRVESRTRELQETHTKYLHAEKLSAIGKLAASIAHEFNNPLQGIVAVLKGLKMAVLREEDKEMLQLAIGESDRLKKLLENLRDFNRPTIRQKMRVDVHDAIHSLLLLVKNDFRRKRIVTELDLAEGLPEIHAVPDQIKQVFLNLLTNAADACNPGGKIAIRTWQERNSIAVAIADNGTGIEPEKQELIFQPFYSTKLETQGTGLGLSVSYGIVKDHHGEIRVKSRPGEGATFTVVLPIDSIGPVVKK